MIVPRSKLLLWVALVVLPFSLLAAVEPSAAAVSFVFMGGLAVLALVDALRARQGLTGIELHLPEVVRMSRNRDAKVEMRIRNERQQPQTLRLALALPGEIQLERAEIDAQLPGASEWSRLEWVCRPARRGRFQVSESHVEGNSPLGFWGMRRRLPTPSEFRVYPNLLTERKIWRRCF